MEIPYLLSRVFLCSELALTSPSVEILDYQQTPLGDLCLRRRAILAQPGKTVTEVTLDHEFLMSSYHTDSERALSTSGIAMRKSSEDGDEDLRVLVGGLGLGYTAREALRVPGVASVHVDEYLPPVISWLERGLIPLAEELRADERFSVGVQDVFARLRSEVRDEGAEFDVILIDVDHSPDELLSRENAGFYSADDLRRARAHLRAGGVLAVWSSATNDAFVEQLREVFEEVRVEPVEWFNELIDEAQRDVLFLAKC